MLKIEIDSPTLEKEINALVHSGLYADLTVLMTDALEKLVTTKRESRLDAAILLYQHGEVTLARAAELAGVHRFEFDAELNAKGIPKTVEVGSVDDLQAGVSVLKQNHKPNGGEKGS
ncbi:MAG: UPF0175 family protein [Candidatus Poribacteria bacterium]|nr:UPF0175 family protein [Candidatus Poribacteria bacterium]MDE0505093.1 UPF0175 family protein [Candidatus Poribacteria bacterium]